MKVSCFEACGGGPSNVCGPDDEASVVVVEVSLKA